MHARQLFAFFGYLVAARWLALGDDAPSRLGASGCVYSSARDLQRFNLALHGGELLPPELYRALIGAPGSEYGLGLARTEHPWGVTLWHNGALAPFGYSSFMAWQPATRTSLVILSNRPRELVQPTARGLELMARLHGEPSCPARGPAAWSRSPSCCSEPEAACSR